MKKKKIYLIRHGETAWTLSGQHTGTTDISLTENGKRQSQLLAKRIKALAIDKVMVSPMQRALETCKITGCANHATLEPLLSEWNYGIYEGLTSQEIRRTDPDWNIFLNGAPEGESVEDVKHRALKLLHMLETVHGNAALFSHGHFLRALTVCFLGLPMSAGRHFILFPGALSILSYEIQVPAISLWNDVSHF